MQSCLARSLTSATHECRWVLCSPQNNQPCRTLMEDVFPNVLSFTGHRGGCSRGSWHRCLPSRAGGREGQSHDSPEASTAAQPQICFPSLRDAVRQTGRLCSPVKQRTKQDVWCHRKTSVKLWIWRKIIGYNGESKYFVWSLPFF